MFVLKEPESTPYVFIRNDEVRGPLQPACDGPYRVIKRHEKNFQVDKDGRKMRISGDRLKYQLI